MLRFEAWQIVAVPFPYVERPIQQPRPTLVVAAGLGEDYGLLWMITAAATRRWPDDVENDEHAAAWLPIPSIVRTAKIATISVGAAKRLGTLPEATAAEVVAVLRKRCHWSDLLKGDRKGHWAVWVSGNWRVTYDLWQARDRMAAIEVRRFEPA